MQKVCGVTAPMAQNFESIALKVGLHRHLAAKAQEI